MLRDVAELLKDNGILPSAQRVAIADYVLTTQDHPSADIVWKTVAADFPYISRATVYNTLNLFVEKGLLKALSIAEDSVVFDSNVATHHHFIDEESGAIYDIPWEKVQVSNIEDLKGYQVRDYQVVIRGTRKPSRKSY